MKTEHIHGYRIEMEKFIYGKVFTVSNPKSRLHDRHLEIFAHQADAHKFIAASRSTVGKQK